ncbi:MAG TPA: hypothetical protein VFP72_06070 [Kineosporiaceae bacterium]|nr:hypothetical protein [Kineosporiaceae bacterium]
MTDLGTTAAPGAPGRPARVKGPRHAAETVEPELSLLPRRPRSAADRFGSPCDVTAVPTRPDLHTVHTVLDALHRL